MSAAALRDNWGDAYFERYYGNPATWIASPGARNDEGRWLALMLQRLKLRPKRAVDIGSGTGEFALGLEYSSVYPVPKGFTVLRVDPYAPDRGAIRAEALHFPFEADDLIVCRDVLHYFDDDYCARVLRRFNDSGAVALYLRVICAEDGVTDASDDALKVEHRPAAWYRERLGMYIGIGFGLFVRGDVGIAMSALERPEWWSKL